MNNSKVTWKFIALWIVVCLLIGIVGSSLKAQNFEQADSVGLVQLDSLYQLYFEWTRDDGGKNAVYSEPLDSATAANFAFNVGVGSGQILVQAAQMKMQKDRVDALQADVGKILTTLTGKNFAKTSEDRFINNLTPNCDTISPFTCQGYYTLTRRNETNRILRIRDSGLVREVNSSGANVAGGIQGNVKFIAGSNQFEINITAPAGLVGVLTFTTIDSKRNRQRWSTDDAKATRYTLVQRKALSDTGASSLNTSK